MGSSIRSAKVATQLLPLSVEPMSFRVQQPRIAVDLSRSETLRWKFNRRRASVGRILSWYTLCYPMNATQMS